MWMDEIDRFAKEGVFRILVGNKCDLESQRKVPKEKGKELADMYGILFLETSAKDTLRIDDLFIEASRDFLSKQGSEAIVKPSSKKPISLAHTLVSTKAKKKKKIC